MYRYVLCKFETEAFINLCALAFEGIAFALSFKGELYFYFAIITGEILEIEITSPGSCKQKDTTDVLSTIILQCDPQGNVVSCIRFESFKRKYCQAQSKSKIWVSYGHFILARCKLHSIYFVTFLRH